LTAGTTYHYRAVANAGAVTVDGADQQFTTTGNTPVQGTLAVSTNSASIVSTTAVSLSGTLTALGTSSPVTVWFEWGTSTNYGYTIAASPGSVTAAPTVITANLGNLTPGTTYHYRARAAAGAASAAGVDQQFTPGATSPVVATNAASGITATSAVLKGNLNAVGNSIPVTVWFEWGTSTGYGYSAAGSPSSITAAPTAFSANLGSLAAGTTYHYRAVANAGAVTVYGADQQFTSGSQ
jgi:hypothetical protein